MRGRLEAGHRPPVEELRDHLTVKTQAHDRLDPGGERHPTWLSLGHGPPEHGQDLAAPVLEESVIERELGREILVQRGRLDAHAPGHLGQAQPGDALLGHHLDGDVEDLADRLLASALSAVRCHRRASQWRCLIRTTLARLHQSSRSATLHS